MLCTKQTIALILLFIIAIVNLYIFFRIKRANRKNDVLWKGTSEKIHNSHIPFLYLNNLNISGIEDIRLDIDLNVISKGTIIVNDSITISGTIDDSKSPQKVSSIMIGFQNGLSPETQDSTAKFANMIFHKTQESGKWEASAIEIMWPFEGKYYPKIWITSEKGRRYDGMTTDVAITVYPISVKAQIITNEMSIILAFGTYILGLIIAADVIIRLWFG